MFYRDDQETIISDVDQHGDSKITYVSQEEKLETYRFINSRLVNSIKQNQLVCLYKNEEVHMVAEAMNRAPLYCNFLTSRGYKNILFVGHYNSGQYHWYLDKAKNNPNTRMYMPFPPERNHLNYYPDINIILQFIPIFMKKWGYAPKVTIARPPESRHRGLIHYLYNKFKVADNMETCNRQYKHGTPFDWKMKDRATSAEKFDAVVFAGIPMHDGKQSFNLDQVKHHFAKYCTSNVEYVDIWNNYDLDDGMRFFRSQRKHRIDVTGNIGEVITTRAIWDKETRNAGRPEEYGFLKRQIKVYSSEELLVEDQNTD